MEYVQMLENSLRYTIDALWGRWSRWLLLLIGMIIFPLDYGYLVRIMRGQDPAPDFDKIGELFVDGLKLFVVYFGYIAIGYGIVLALMIAASIAGGVGSIASLLAALVGGAIMVLIVFMLQMAIVRFARAGRVGEAFNISEILDHIGRIGWGVYILSQIILWIALSIMMMIPPLSIFGVITSIAAFIFFNSNVLLGFLLSIIMSILLIIVLAPAVYIFMFRYNTLVYESARIGF